MYETESDINKSLETIKVDFQTKTLISVLKVQDRLLEIMADMKEANAESEESEEIDIDVDSDGEEKESEDFDYDEFEAVLDLYKTLTQIVEL